MRAQSTSSRLSVAVARIITVVFGIAAIAPSANAQSNKGGNHDYRSHAIELKGSVWGARPDGETIFAAYATISFWPADSATTALFDRACVASRTKPGSWMVARTEFSNPTGFTLDSSATSDLQLLGRIASIPHGTGHADFAGHFNASGLQPGSYLLEAETIDGGNIVQWWKPIAISDTTDPRGATSDTLASMGPQYVTSSQFCSKSEALAGATAPRIVKPPYSPDRIYESGQVDQPAREPPWAAPEYPEKLRAAHVTGSVTIAFVVDATGRVEMATARVIRSDNAAFTQSALATLGKLTFTPATREGHNVQVAVTQTFSFNVAY
jgi:TonB family protein